jgi:hypothetical protein
MTIIDPPATDREVLTPSTLNGFRERAAEADRNNTYFHEDLAVLTDLGYLGAAVPRTHGGLGLGLRQLVAEQRRLARHAPATALGMCMHHYWVGIANELEELERLYRDVRCGGFHPANDALTHELVAKITLGLDPGGPRW